MPGPDHGAKHAEMREKSRLAAVKRRIFRGAPMFTRDSIRAFARNRDGGVAPMLALAALPLFGFVGAGIDFSRAASARTAMQSALDAAALMMAKEAKNVDA